MRLWLILVLLVAIGLIVLPGTAAAPQVLIRYGGSAAQFELTSPQGVRVLIDIFDRAALSRPPTAEDILLTTHEHYDHYNSRFCDAFPGKQLRIRAGSLSVGDVQIKGIPSYHNVSDPKMYKFAPVDGTNYIFVIETAGLKIVHFGDIGQDALTPAQLKDLRQVDVALTQFNNNYSAMNIDNKLGFKLMEAIHPKLMGAVPLGHAATRCHEPRLCGGVHAGFRLFVFTGRGKGSGPLSPFAFTLYPHLPFPLLPLSYPLA